MEDWLLERILWMCMLITCLSVHEWAHAAAAYRLGDDTAHHLGRMTLDPTAHLDPVGSLLLPFIGVPFGWAVPVPVNPLRFRGVSLRLGMVWVAAAGPLSNLALAIVGVVLEVVAVRVGAPSPAVDALGDFVLLNVALAVFNLLPVPPLDGSRVVDGLLSGQARQRWQQLGSFVGPMVIVVVALLSFSFGLLDLMLSALRWPLKVLLGA